MLDHEPAAHANIPPFACQYCDKKFASLADLKQHRRRSHRRQFLHRCGWCRRHFPSESALQRHRCAKAQLAPSGGQNKTPFKCRFCAKPLKSRDNQLAHERWAHSQVRPFKCGHCQHSFVSAQTLDLHKRMKHAKVLPIHCECGRSFAFACHMRSHLRWIGGHQFQCAQCAERFTYKSALRSHIQSTHTARFYCCLCLCCFKGKDAIVRHLAGHAKGSVNKRSSSARLRCSWCFLSFPDKTALQEHLAEHTCSGQRALFKCRLCAMQLMTERGQSEHEQRVHRTRSPGFACQHCGKTFFHAFELKGHVRFRHERQSLVRCCWCLRAFASKISLQKHLTKHWRSGHIHLVKCRFCAMRLRTASNRMVHERTVHSRVRPFKCDMCSAAFNFKSLLRYHKRLRHSNVPLPFRCETCGKGFLSAYPLQRHVREAHECSYQCAQCAQRFTRRKRKLQQHIRMAHPASGVFFCCVCLRRYDAVDAIARHLAWHARRERVKETVEYACGLCGISFRSSESLAAHLNKVHTLKCRFCPMTFQGKVRRRKHHNAHLDELKKRRRRADANVLVEMLGKRDVPLVRSLKCEVCSLVCGSEAEKRDHEYNEHMRRFVEQSRQVFEPYQTVRPPAVTSAQTLPIQFQRALLSHTFGLCSRTFPSPLAKSVHENYAHPIGTNSTAGTSITQNMLTNGAQSGHKPLNSASNVVDHNNFVNGTSSGSTGSPVPTTPVGPGVFSRALPLKDMMKLIKGVVDANGQFLR